MNGYLKKTLSVLVPALITWGLCGATIGAGSVFTTMQTTLIIHAVAAPVFAALTSWVYFRKFNHTTPFQTALIFLFFVMIMDAGLVAPVFEKSYEMFTNVLGTWIPFALIFVSTYITGLIFKGKNN